MEWKELRAALRGLTVYREELETEIGRSVAGLLDALHRQDGEEALAAYTGLFAALCREEFQGLGDWLWDRLRFHESAYSLLIDQGGSAPVLEQAARQDVDTLVRLAGTGCSCFLDAIQALLPPEFAPVLAGLSQWRTGSPFDFDTLTAFYREHGAGLYAKYRAFLWEDGSLIPVADPDCPHPVELLGYAPAPGLGGVLVYLSVENLSARTLPVGASYLHSRDVSTLKELYSLDSGVTARCGGESIPCGSFAAPLYAENAADASAFTLNLAAGRGAMLHCFCAVPEDWEALELSYRPAFAAGQPVEFVVRRDADAVRLGPVPATPAEVGSVVDL